MSYPFPLHLKDLSEQQTWWTVTHLKSLGVTRAGSNPAPGTKEIKDLWSGMDLALINFRNNVASLRNTLLVGDPGPLQYINGTAQITL